MFQAASMHFYETLLILFKNILRGMTFSGERRTKLSKLIFYYFVCWFDLAFKMAVRKAIHSNIQNAQKILLSCWLPIYVRPISNSWLFFGHKYDLCKSEIEKKVRFVVSLANKKNKKYCFESIYYKQKANGKFFYKRAKNAILYKLLYKHHYHYKSIHINGAFFLWCFA